MPLSTKPSKVERESKVVHQSVFTQEGKEEGKSNDNNPKRVPNRSWLMPDQLKLRGNFEIAPTVCVIEGNQCCIVMKNRVQEVSVRPKLKVECRVSSVRSGIPSSERSKQKLQAALMTVGLMGVVGVFSDHVR
jgi:hypothetical protein